jgi:hypothetical protein
MKLAVLQPFEVVIWGASKDVPLYRIGVQAFSEDEAKADGIAHFRRSLGPVDRPPKVGRVEVLSDVHLDTARKQQTLFEDLADACIGHSMADVQGACVNLLLTSMQRRYQKLADAEARWDELAGRGKEALRRRYSGASDARDAAVETEIAKRLIG